MSTQQPFNNLQPSLAVTEVTLTQGIFPSGGGGGSATGDLVERVRVQRDERFAM